MFRYALGVLYGIGAITFLLGNSYILGKFGYDGANEYWTQIVLASISAVVPWMLAPIHFVISERYDIRGQATWLGYVKGLVYTLPIMMIYLAFVAFNVIGGSGSVAFARMEIADEKTQIIDETERLKELRLALKNELAAIPSHRPKEAMVPLIQVTRQHKFWEWTDHCDPKAKLNSKAQTLFCADYLKLEAELASASKADSLLPQIETIDKSLNQPKRAVSTADPQVEFLHDLTGVAKKYVAFTLLLIRPLILELGALTFGGWSLRFFGVRLGLIEDEAYPPPTRRALPAALVAEPIEIVGHLSGEDRALQMTLLEQFWSTCTRHLSDGRMTEVDAFTAYRNFCAARNCLPVDTELFRRTASQHVRAVVEVAGTTWYHGLVLCNPPPRLSAVA